MIRGYKKLKVKKQKGPGGPGGPGGGPGGPGGPGAREMGGPEAQRPREPSGRFWALSPIKPINP